MNVVDSSAWLEYFGNGPNAAFFRPVIERAGELIVPTLVVYEVFKRALRLRGEEAALEVVAVMQQGLIVELDSKLAIDAAKLSSEFQLPLADSVILATSRAWNATLWTQDSDFKDFDGVRYREYRRS